MQVIFVVLELPLVLSLICLHGGTGNVLVCAHTATLPAFSRWTCKQSPVHGSASAVCVGRHGVVDWPADPAHHCQLPVLPPAEYERYAKLMTSLHAQPPTAKRPHGPLTTSGANAASSNAADGSSAGIAAADGSPLVKKPKPERSLAAAKVKKSLKRL